MGSRSYAVLMASLSQQEMLGSAKEKEGFFMIVLELYDYNALRFQLGLTTDALGEQVVCPACQASPTGRA